MKWLSFCFTLLSCATALRAAEKPHIILVMADDQGWGDMAYNGHSEIKTPNFDQLAASGIRFDRFYAAAPVCSPTRASVLTGRNPNRMGVYQWGYPMRPQEHTLAEILRDAGYTTGHFGKWHLGSVRRGSTSNPGVNGFDRWVSAPNFYDNGATLSDEGTAVSFEGVESSFIAVDCALEWIEKALPKDPPIFAVIWFGSPHHPHRAAKQDAARYPDVAPAERNFLGEVTGMDRAVGKLRRRIEELGMRDDTLLWYCSDNGALPKVGETGGFRGHKGEVYEGGLLVPSILEWPARFPEHRVVKGRSNTFDILPTVLEAAGVAAPKDRVLDGESLLPQIDGERDRRTRPMGFWHTRKGGISTPSAKWMKALKEAQAQGRDLPPDAQVVAAMELPDPAVTVAALAGHAAWIDGDWKLHRIAGRGGGEARYELYDLAADGYETNNVAGAHVARLGRMSAALDDWLQSVTASLNGADY